MGSSSEIQWTDATWNPIRGCSMAKGSEAGGCLNCYAARMAARNLPGLKSPTTGEPFAIIRDSGPRWTGKVELIESMLDLPLRWQKPRKIFVDSMSDLFHEALSDEDLLRIFTVMGNSHLATGTRGSHIFQVLTKRAQRMHDIVARLRWKVGIGFVAMSGRNHIVNNMPYLEGSEHWHSITGSGPVQPQERSAGWMPENIWLGVSVEDQQRADERIPLLLQTPAAVRFVSYEPALGPVDFSRINHTAVLREQLAKAVKWLAEKDGEDSAAAFKRAAESVSDEGLPEDEKPSLNSLTGEWFDGWDSGQDGRKLNWIIVGGESGPGARPFNIEWARGVIAQCKAASVSCFVKQFGAKPFSIADHITHRGNSERMPNGFYRYLNDRKGGDMSEFPEDLRVRELPEATR